MIFGGNIMMNRRRLRTSAVAAAVLCGLLATPTVASAGEGHGGSVSSGKSQGSPSTGAGSAGSSGAHGSEKGHQAGGGGKQSDATEDCVTTPPPPPPPPCTCGNSTGTTPPETTKPVVTQTPSTTPVAETPVTSEAPQPETTAPVTTPKTTTPSVESETTKPVVEVETTQPETTAESTTTETTETPSTETEVSEVAPPESSKPAESTTPEVDEVTETPGETSDFTIVLPEWPTIELADITLSIPKIGLPQVGRGGSPIPQSGPQGESIVAHDSPDGDRVYGYVPAGGEFTPLAYRDGLTFQTGRTAPTLGTDGVQPSVALGALGFLAVIGGGAVAIGSRRRAR